MLYDFMDTLNTDVDDASIEEIADKLMVMREECSEGNFGLIRSLRETYTPNLSYVRQPGINDDEESEDDTLREDNSSEMEVDTPQQSQPIPCQKDSVTNHTNTAGTPEVVDEWKVVCSKRSKIRKKPK